MILSEGTIASLGVDSLFTNVPDDETTQLMCLIEHIGATMDVNSASQSSP